MNDNSFKFLCELIMSKPIKLNRLDVSGNCLTNNSMKLINELQNRNIKVKFENNFIQEKRELSFIPPIEHNVNILSIQNGEVSYNEIMSAIYESNKKTNESIEKTNAEIIKLSKLVEAQTKSISSLDKRVEQHQKIFDKQFKKIERQISDMILNRFKKFKHLDYSVLNPIIKDTSFEGFPETDILLLSEDGQVIIIGEAKHDVIHKAFIQIDARISLLKDSILMNDLPPELKNLKHVIGVIGGDRFSNQFKEIAKKKNIMIISKLPEYQIENDEIHSHVLNNYI